jgi:uncharacterized protein
MDLQNRTVLLTGATGGIGHAIARRLHTAGTTLILTGRRTDVLEPLAKEIGARALAADLANAADVERLADQCAEVDVLIANAALPGTGTLDSYDVDGIDRVLAVNLRAPIVLSRLIGERMLARGSGHLVFISSLSGKVSSPSSCLYNATKFGLRGFAQGLRADWSPRGVGVSCVFPGFIREAGMFYEGGAKLPRGVGTRSPEEVAEAVVRAIVRDKGEIDVAPLSLRLGAMFAGVAPGTAARVTKLAGADQVARELAQGQRDKR